MNTVVIRGALAGAPREHSLASGSTLVSFDVVTDIEGRRVGVPVSWFDPPAGTRPFEDGDEVVVVGSVQRRFFRAAGSTQARTDVVASRVVLARRQSQVRELLSGWWESASAAVLPAVQPLPSSAKDNRKRFTKLTSPARNQTRGS